LRGQAHHRPLSRCRFRSTLVMLIRQSPAPACMLFNISIYVVILSRRLQLVDLRTRTSYARFHLTGQLSTIKTCIKRIMLVLPRSRLSTLRCCRNLVVSPQNIVRLRDGGQQSGWTRSVVS
jgi:hypothetical protein